MDVRRKLTVVAVLAAALAVVIPPAFAIAPGTLAVETAGAPATSASVVRVEHVVPPRKRVVHRSFRPWARPTTAQVQDIILSEARRWRIPAGSLARRVNCESRFHWWAGNGQYQGVLQFSPGAFYRGLSTIRDHRVNIVRTKLRRVHITRVTHYADGRKVSRRTTPRRQRLVVVYSGRLPGTPSVSHAFAQLRIGAQAIRGISAVRSSEWSCGT